MTPGPGLALAPEAVVHLHVDGVLVVSWRCTPHSLEELAVGWLAGEGVLRERGDLLGIEMERGTPEVPPVISVRLDEVAERRLARLEAPAVGAASVGSGWSESQARSAEGPTALPDSPTGEVRALLAEPGLVADLFRRMFECARLRQELGGVHTGGLVLDGELAHVAEDVSRHHVVDRLIGSAVLSRGTAVGSIFLLSSRISGAMAAKACRTHVAALISRSIPTDLAARTAASCGVVLVGRARRECPQVHWPGR